MGFSFLPNGQQNQQIVAGMSTLTGVATTAFTSSVLSLSKMSLRTPTMNYEISAANAGAAANQIQATVQADPNYFANQVAGLSRVTSVSVGKGVGLFFNVFLLVVLMIWSCD
jgi:hypothetical protein